MQFRLLESSELRGYDRGICYTSVCINPAIYLPWLIIRCLAAGVQVQRQTLNHISEAFVLDSSSTTPRLADLVVNCTGLSAKTLGGVQDAKMYPIRGQTLLVRNEAAGHMVENSGVDAYDDELVYIMQRAAGRWTKTTFLMLSPLTKSPGGGTLIGGSYQKHNWNAEVDAEQAKRMARRAVELLPELVAGGSSNADASKLDIVRHSVGFRPAREGGTRVEKEAINVGGKRKYIVHSYGHGGFGYQSSIGCAMEVDKLVQEALAAQSKL